MPLIPYSLMSIRILLIAYCAILKGYAISLYFLQVRSEVAAQKEDADMEKAFSMFDKLVVISYQISCIHLGDTPCDETRST